MSSKRGGHHDDEGHGGQWKVAYADFVTAMMAFFLIMWLVSSATETDRAVIAKYFNNTSLFNLPGGNGVLNGGKSVMDGSEAKSPRLAPTAGGGKKADASSEVSADQQGQGKAQQPANTGSRLDRQRLEAVKAEIERVMNQAEMHDLSHNLLMENTPEGLRIQIFDRDGEAMFAPGAIEPTPRMMRILEVIGQVLGTVQNRVILAGHTDAQALQRGAYSNWELSSDRANAVRRVLLADGVGDSRFQSVEGRAATDLLLPQSPVDPRNRRIAVTVLRNDPDAPAAAADPSSP